jgi:hypothetical protein
MRRRWRPSALVATPEEEAPWWPQLWWRRPVGLACAPPPGSQGEEGRENEKLGLGLRKLVYIWMSWALSRSNVTGRVMLPIFGSCPCRATMSRVRSRHSPTIRLGARGTILVVLCCYSVKLFGVVSGRPVCHCWPALPLGNGEQLPDNP